MPVSHLYVFFGKMALQVFYPFLIRLQVFLILSCMSCLYILDINSLSVISFTNVFSHSVVCLSVLLIVSLSVQKLLNLIGSHLFFSFISFVLGNRSKKNISTTHVKMCSVCFPLGVLWFQVLHLCLQTIFRFIFVYGIRGCSDFIILHVVVQFSQSHLLKKIVFLLFF